jgi:galactokinase/mevalonate kinase-like predicted kinase
MAINVAISYYVYAILSASQLEGVQVTFDGSQIACKHPLRERSDGCGELGLLRAIVQHFNVHDGQMVFVASQVPARCGLKVRGSLAVSMIKLLAFGCGLDLGPDAVAEMATEIYDRDREPLASSPPYGAALGGVWFADHSSRTVTTARIKLSEKTRLALQQGLMLFAPFLSSGSVVMSDKEQAAYGAMVVDGGDADQARELTLGLRRELERGDVDSFGRLLHRCWVHYSRVWRVESLFEQGYQTARDCGALGGQTTGHGKDRFLLLYCPPASQDAVNQALADMGLQQWPLTLDSEGVQVMQAMPWSWAGPFPRMPQPQYPMSR